jgi:hypothetical protein
MSRDRLGASAERVNWIVADVTTWQPIQTYDVWHDRAAFHFLTDPMTARHMPNAFAKRYVRVGTSSLELLRRMGQSTAAGCQLSVTIPRRLVPSLAHRSDLRRPDATTIGHLAAAINASSSVQFLKPQRMALMSETWVKSRHWIRAR